jgi:hypothetical protein
MGFSGYGFCSLVISNGNEQVMFVYQPLLKTMPTKNIMCVSTRPYHKIQTNMCQPTVHLSLIVYAYNSCRNCPAHDCTCVKQ